MCKESIVLTVADEDKGGIQFGCLILNNIGPIFEMTGTAVPEPLKMARIFLTGCTWIRLNFV